MDRSRGIGVGVLQGPGDHGELSSEGRGEGCVGQVRPT